MQTISLSGMCSKIATALAASTAITSYCTTAYGSAPSIYVGINGKNPPNDTNCPFIVVMPGQKTEGPQIEEHVYQIMIGWGIVNTSATTSGKIITQTGLTQADAIGQLIYAALENAGSYPPSQISYVLEGLEFYPQFVGRLEAEIRVTPALGGTLAY